jgi:hypothetical protein
MDKALSLGGASEVECTAVYTFILPVGVHLDPRDLTPDMHATVDAREPIQLELVTKGLIRPSGATYSIQDTAVRP